MIYGLIIIILFFIIIVILKNKDASRSEEDDLELFSTKKFQEKENIKSAKCPQCGKIATTYEEVRKKFGLRKVGYATDIQSWCRECRKDRDENQEKPELSDDLELFDE